MDISWVFGKEREGEPFTDLEIIDSNPGMFQFKVPLAALQSFNKRCNVDCEPYKGDVSLVNKFYNCSTIALGGKFEFF